MRISVEATTSWPSPAQDYFDGPISLDKHLIRQPAATFLLRVSSGALISRGIYPGDELIVDRSLIHQPGHVLVVDVDGELRVGVYRIRNGQPLLVSDNETIPLGPNSRLWGVIPIAIHHLGIDE